MFDQLRRWCFSELAWGLVSVRSSLAAWVTEREKEAALGEYRTSHSRSRSLAGVRSAQCSVLTRQQQDTNYQMLQQMLWYLTSRKIVGIWTIAELQDEERRRRKMRRRRVVEDNKDGLGGTGPKGPKGGGRREGKKGKGKGRRERRLKNDNQPTLLHADDFIFFRGLFDARCVIGAYRSVSVRTERGEAENRRHRAMTPQATNPTSSYPTSHSVCQARAKADGRRSLRDEPMSVQLKRLMQGHGPTRSPG